MSNYKAIHNNLTFIIEEDLPEIGFYLYIYKKGKCIYDTLQDDLETVKEIALDEYYVPYESWEKEV